MDGAGAGEDEAVVALAEPEEEAREREQEREGDGQDRVDLLPGVEPALRRAAAAEPAPVVAVDRLDLAPVVGEPLAVADDEDHDDRDRPGDGDPDVDVLDELAAADQRRERREVEDQPGREQREERRGVRPVQDALGAGEAPMRRRGSDAQASSHSTARSMRPRRSRSAPSSRSARAAELDVVHPLDALVAVHLRHHEPHGGAVRPRERLAVHLVGEHHVGEQRLLAP